MHYLFKIAQLVLQENKCADELLETGYPQEEIDYIFRLLDLLEQNGYKCNADARAEIARTMPSPGTRELEAEEWKNIIWNSLSVGSCEEGESYCYSNAQGFIAKALCTDMYNLPEGMVNPHLFCFSGMMTAHLCAFEVIRFYAKHYHDLLPLVCIGKGGNKGLFDKVFNREQGLMSGTEYQAYLNCLCQLAPEDYVRANERVCRDMDTAGNFDEIYLTARSKGLSEITAVLCTGNFSYDRRLLAEAMWRFREEKYRDVKINLILVHCPMTLNLSVPEGHLSEILLGYIAASLGPLMKDTISFDGRTQSDRPERYLIPGIAAADWSKFEKLISQFSNMGWPDYQEILYGVSHRLAVTNIILSDLYARASFTPGDYEEGLKKDIADYQQVIGKYQGGDFLQYLVKTPDVKYF